MKKLINIIKYFIAIQRLKYAIQLANTAHKKTGDRHFVIATEGKHNRLIVINRKMLRTYRRSGMVNPNAAIVNLKRESFYFTPCRDGSERLSDINLQAKREMYIKWYFNDNIYGR